MNDEKALKLGALKVVSDYTKQRYDEARSEAAEYMRRGDRLMARSPTDDRKIGAVSMSDPKPSARITDETALNEWIAKHYPESMVYDFEVIGSQQEVVAELFEHAPHLLRKIQKPDPEVVQQIKADSTNLGTPIGPGGEADIEGIAVEPSKPVVSCKPDPDALGVVVDLFRAGQLNLEELVRPEIEGGQE